MIRQARVLLVAALFASAGATARAQTYPAYGQGAAATPAASPDPALLRKAESVFTQLQTGKLDRSELATGGPNGNMTDAAIANAQKMVGGFGPPVSFVAQQTSSQGGVSAAIYLITFKNGQKVNFLFAVDSQGKVQGMSLGTPH
ncbi:MAG TPA: hypothetical protein VN909_01960 [Candidatus Dormibacteraeota bacterium]|nr:hypothetical protein [Candidatus Dormibacteraeota bacterium]